MSGLDPLVQILKAAGEVTRLRLLALLLEGELSVKDLTAILEQSQPRISRHLRLLSDAGLIERHAEGAWAYFCLARAGDGIELVHQIVARLDGADGDVAADLVRLEALRESQRRTAAAYFAKVADSWDLLRSLHVPEEAVESAIIAEADREKVGLLLDLGTGTGRMLELLADRYQSGIGIDSSREMLAVARARLTDAHIVHAAIRHGDIADLRDYKTSADLVILHQVLHYFDDPGQMLQVARQTLKPGGRMIVVDFAPHELEFLRKEHAHRRLGISTGQVQTWAQAASLSVTAFQDFPSEDGADGLTVCLWTLKDDTN